MFQNMGSKFDFETAAWYVNNDRLDDLVTRLKSESVTIEFVDSFPESTKPKVKVSLIINVKNKNSNIVIIY